MIPLQGPFSNCCVHCLLCDFSCFLTESAFVSFRTIRILLPSNSFSNYTSVPGLWLLSACTVLFLLWVSIHSLLIPPILAFYYALLDTLLWILNIPLLFLDVSLMIPFYLLFSLYPSLFFPEVICRHLLSNTFFSCYSFSLAILSTYWFTCRLYRRCASLALTSLWEILVLATILFPFLFPHQW